ncbi:MAG TPA: VWA domain-containing protein [Gemmatimonadales bacterium]|nr:VWA domain-containing protein [Gemmatimonadales bacterium]
MSANNEWQVSIPLDPGRPTSLRVETPFGPAQVHGDVLLANISRFARLMRRAGLDADGGQTASFAQALTLLGFDRRADVRAAGRAIFVRRREDVRLYEAAFDLFWRRRTGAKGVSDRLPRIRQEERQEWAADPSGPGEDASRDQDLVAAVRPGASSITERLRHADFATLSPDEARDAAAMLEALRPRLPIRPARRSRAGPSGHRPAARAMLRRAMSTGGEALRWRWLRRLERPRPIVLVCDISGSMERYSRFMLRFAHALHRSGAPLEVFVFGTRLTRITRQLRLRNPDAALRRVAEKVVDWSGGTRIGESLRDLNRRWVRRTIRSGAIVLLVSDGWERGDPALLAREMGTLRRSCHRLLWIDPLASRPGFEPATVGLQAALPFVDELVPAASVASLEELASRLVKL